LLAAAAVLLTWSGAGLAEEKRPSAGAEVVYSKTLLGKEYRIERIAAQKGAYQVSWGQETMKWEPKPYYEEELNQQGPMFYVDYSEQMKKLFPYNVPLEEREKFSGFEVQNSGAFFGPFTTGALDLEDQFEAHLYSPTGTRRDKTGFEYNKWFLEGRTRTVWDPNDTSGKPYRKYIFVFRSPKDLAKVGFLQIQYQGKKEDDNLLYVPTVRKVRRLATANRQDVAGGMVIRQEQNALMTPIHNYKMTGSQLMRFPETDPTFGFEGTEDQGTPVPEYKRADGLGEPCWVYETTPFREDWWFARQLTYVGIFSMTQWRQDSFDANGRLTQRMMWFQEHSPLGEASRPVPQTSRKTFLSWGGAPVKDYTTGFLTIFYPSQRTVNPDLPDGMYNTNSLLEEPKVIDFYRR
jgi:hypothetical protein